MGSDFDFDFARARGKRSEVRAKTARRSAGVSERCREVVNVREVQRNTRIEIENENENENENEKVNNNEKTDDVLYTVPCPQHLYPIQPSLHSHRASLPLHSES